MLTIPVNKISSITILQHIFSLYYQIADEVWENYCAMYICNRAVNFFYFHVIHICFESSYRRKKDFDQAIALK